MVKAPKLPTTLRFEDLGPPGERVIGGALCFYRLDGFRLPKRGEWFVSGAIPMAYRAKRDLSTSYHVAVPTHFAKPATGYVRGGEVVLSKRSENESV